VLAIQGHESVGQRPDDALLLRMKPGSHLYGVGPAPELTQRRWTGQDLTYLGNNKAPRSGKIRGALLCVEVVLRLGLQIRQASCQKILVNHLTFDA